MVYTEVFNSHVVSEEFARCISKMPKVETHVHLEGATDAELIFKMARRNDIPLPVSTLEEWKAYYEFLNFDHFVEIYKMAVACIRTPQDFFDIAIEFLSRQAEQNIQYTEAYFSPALHRGKLPDDEIIAALAEGAKAASERFGVRVAFIPDISREACRQKELQDYVLGFAVKARDYGIGVGLGIGGKEIGNPPELYRDVFAEARQQGLHVVAHGGETDGPQSVRGAIEALRAERIGHGIRALEDEELIQVLRERQIPVEVSPQSNYCTRVVKRDEPHPIRRMIDAGLYCTLNSDDPPMFSTNLNNEYLTLAAQGFTFEELWSLNLNGLNASFLEDSERVAMKSIWQKGVEQDLAQCGEIIRKN